MALFEALGFPFKQNNVSSSYGENIANRKSKRKPKFTSRLVRRCWKCGRYRSYMQDLICVVSVRGQSWRIRA